MSLFDTLIVQPIFNLLMTIYTVLPGHDLGISLIIFGVLVRLLMWPLIKKQLHQTKVMRSIQPDLKRIKLQAKGNKQVEGQLMLELYRERGVNPFSSFGVLLIQLPIFIALFSVVRIIATQRDQIGNYMYHFVAQLEPVARIIHDPKSLNESFLGFIDLTKHAMGSEGAYIPLIILALISAALQYYQSKQITPVPDENKKLRDVFKASADGKSVDQSEVSALLSQKMIVFFPIMAFFIAIYLPGALVLFYAVSSGVAVIQQHYILKEDITEMEVLADKTSKQSKNVSEQTKVRVLNAQDAEVVLPKKRKSTKNRKKR